MIAGTFSKTADTWIGYLNNYPWPKMLLKPDPSSWSLGQVYMHLIEETNWYFDQAMACFGNSDFIDGETKEAGIEMLKNNSFPNIIVKGDPLISENVPQPLDKASIIAGFNKLKQRASLIEEKITQHFVHGKSAHPGLGYFTPAQWLQYSEMHLRHHLRQKQRIDLFLSR